jgi:hypothetical protein
MPSLWEVFETEVRSYLGMRSTNGARRSPDRISIAGLEKK